MSPLARALFLLALPMACAETPAVTIHVRLEANGDVIIRTSSRQAGLLLAPVIHCRGGMRSDGGAFGEFRCKNALRREGLSLEATFDFAPIAQALGAGDDIQLWLEYPRLGFAASSLPLLGPLKDEGASFRVVQTGRFPAGAAMGAVRIQFGYHLDQLAAIYLPLAALALALMCIAMGLSRGGHADLLRSAFLLGTMFWLGAAAWLRAAEPLRILLFGTPFASIAAALMEYYPPLLAVAAGAGLGNRKRADRMGGERFADILRGFGMVLFPVASALGAVPSMVEGDWIGAAPWLAAAPISVLVFRWRIRGNASVRVRELGGGELRDRVSELAAKMGRQGIRVYVSSSARAQTLNAFALRRNSILLTARLVQSLTKREVDAVAAHELSHFGHTRRSSWTALVVAAVMFQMPFAELFLQSAGGLLVALLLPLTVFFATLLGTRKREFAADAGAAALTGDPRAMIGALARIARSNGTPLGRNVVAEWFSTHPSTEKRVRALAAAGRLERAEVETLCNTDDPDVRYTLPPEEGAPIFTLAWQKANAARYTWVVLLGASGAGLFVVLLFDKLALSGFPQLLGGIVLGCAITKVLAATVMSSGYAGLKCKLAAKLGAGGQLVGLAVDSEPRVYNGYRFSDAGFLSFEGGRLCYRSERATIELNPADVVEVGMVAAAPSSWRRLQPIIRMRVRESGETNAFILHPVEWGATPRRLLQSIERWKATATSAESTSITGITAVAGQPFRVPTMARVLRGFRVPGAVTLVGATLAGWFPRTESWPGWYALAITACAYTFMFLPALLYRPSAIPPALKPRVDAD